MSSVHAMEKILGIEISPEIRTLRRLLYCAEWIESHALHMYLLHAPDFLGYESAISMAANPDLRPAVEQGLRMKKIGNELLAIIGGREVHPISPTVGGFYRAPTKDELLALKADLEWGLQAAIDTVGLGGDARFPRLRAGLRVRRLRHPDEYPMNEGRVVVPPGLDIAMEEFEDYLHQRPCGSFQRRAGASRAWRQLHTGPLARVNLNLDKLSPLAQKALDGYRHPLPQRQSLHQHRRPRGGIGARVRGSAADYRHRTSAAHAQPITAPAQGGTRLPHHRSAARHALPPLRPGRQGLDSGRLASMRPPPRTCAAWRMICVRSCRWCIDLPLEEATWRCEQLVRNYDPCISCATHFLKLNIERR